MTVTERKIWRENTGWCSLNSLRCLILTSKSQADESGPLFARVAESLEQRGIASAKEQGAQPPFDDLNDSAFNGNRCTATFATGAACCFAAA
jgi:hypothetical protein